MTGKSLKTETFTKIREALKFIDELEKKNKRCHGKLNCFPTEEEDKYLWHVTYDPAWLKKETNPKVIEAKIIKPKTVKLKVKSKLKPARAKR